MSATNLVAFLKSQKDGVKTMSTNDAKIKALLQKVEDQKKDLGSKPRPSYKTNCLFKYKNGNHLNLNTVTDLNVLVIAMGEIIKESECYMKAAERLGLDFVPIDWCGYSIEDWEEDFKARISIINYDQKLKLFKKTQDKLNGLVSEEARTEMELEDIEKLLG